MADKSVLSQMYRPTKSARNESMAKAWDALSEHVTKASYGGVGLQGPGPCFNPTHIEGILAEHGFRLVYTRKRAK